MFFRCFNKSLFVPGFGRMGGSTRWMSVRPPEQSLPLRGRRKVTIQYLQQLRDSKRPITMLTAYDFPTGRACDAHGIDITLVGDSLAQVCLGYDSTTQLTLDEMIHHCRAVSRGSRAPLLVADMPFGTYYPSVEDSVRNAVRLVREGGAEGLKLEGGMEIVDTVRRLSSLGIPVMAHIGLLPQRHISMSGYKVQGKDSRSAAQILKAALALEDAGAFSIVLEAIPYVLGDLITRRCSIPTIGIGAGPHTSGQVLVWDDVMGTWAGHKAKFVRRFADVQSEAKNGVLGFATAVRDGTFPDVETESYVMDDGEWEKMQQSQGVVT